MYKCRGKYEIYLYLHTIYKFTILNSIVSYCTTLTCTININQYQSISINIIQYHSISTNHIYVLYLSLFFRSISLDPIAVGNRMRAPCSLESCCRAARATSHDEQVVIEGAWRKIHLFVHNTCLEHLEHLELQKVAVTSQGQAVTSDMNWWWLMQREQVQIQTNANS